MLYLMIKKIKLSKKKINLFTFGANKKCVAAEKKKSHSYLDKSRNWNAQHGERKPCFLPTQIFKIIKQCISFLEINPIFIIFNSEECTIVISFCQSSRPPGVFLTQWLCKFWWDISSQNIHIWVLKSSFLFFSILLCANDIGSLFICLSQLTFGKLLSALSKLI